MDATLPWPDDAPEPGASLRVDEIEPGLLRIVPDPPNRSFPVLDGPLIADLEALLDRVESERPRGIVIAGRRPNQFLAGADVRAIAQVEDTRVVEGVVRSVHALFDRIENLPCTTVAAVGGAVPGGAFELCLACDAIVLANDERTRIGLPETKLGLIPAWGGLHRVTRRVGVPTALDAVLTGRLYDARRAHRLGLVDRLTAPEYLERVGGDLALGREPLRRRTRGRKLFLVDKNPLVRAVVRRKAKAALDEKTGGHYPAPYAALDAILEAPFVPRKLWAERESVLAGRLVGTEACANLIGLFLGTEDQKKLAVPPPGGSTPRLERVGVIGAGVMGAGIASAFARAGTEVRLVDLDRRALDRAQAEHRKAVQRGAKRSRSRAAATAQIDRLTASTRMDGLGRADLIVEAVAEDEKVKRRVFAELERVAPDAILVSNTSSLSLEALSEGLARPERFAGLHFFNPVARMPLVEVISGPRTDADVIRSLARAAVDLSKTPVLVDDVPGFVVNRLLGPYLDEAVHGFMRGAAVDRVDATAREFGMPMGPFELLDEVGLDIALHASKSLFSGYGERMRPTEGLGKLVHPKRLGRKSGLGFYVHAKDGRASRPADDLAHFRPRHQSNPSSHEVFEAALLALVAEAVRCLDEGVVASARDLDLSVVLGTGFAPFRGGPLHHVDRVGAAHVVERLEALTASARASGHGAGALRFEPPASLVAMAKSGRTYFGRNAARGHSAA